MNLGLTPCASWPKLSVDQNSGPQEKRVSKILPISEVKAHLPALVAGVQQREDEIVVTRKGRPAAMLVNYNEYRSLRATLEVLSDKSLMRQIRRGQRYFARGGKGVPFEEVFGEPLILPRKRAK